MCAVLVLFCVSWLSILIICRVVCVFCYFFFFKQKTAYEMRISDWSSDVCSSDLLLPPNYGPEYVSQFTESFHLIAKHNEIPLVPFLLSPIAADRDASSEERRVGKECVSTCRLRWSPNHSKKKNTDIKIHAEQSKIIAEHKENMSK